jgi:hypothetical protein
MSSTNDSHAALKDQPICVGANSVAGRNAAASRGLAKGSLRAGSSVRVVGRASAAMVVVKNELRAFLTSATVWALQTLHGTTILADHVPCNASVIQPNNTQDDDGDHRARGPS